MARPDRRPLPPDWLPDFLFECDDPLPVCVAKAKADPGEAVARRPSRGRPRQHATATRPVR